MRALRLGLRILVGGGRATTIRIGLMALGSMVGMVAVLSLASIPSVANHQASRLALQQLVPAPAGVAPSVFGSMIEESFDGAQMTRLLVVPARADVAHPAWLTRYPRPGELVASPALVELMEANPTIEARFPQRRIQVLGPEVLVAPDQLLAVVGATRSDLPSDGRDVIESIGFQTGGTSWEGPDPRAVRLVVVGAVIFVLLPLAAFLSSGARLSARTRRDRLALLRLIGMSPRATAAVGWVEVLAASLIGSSLGYVVWRVAVRWSEGVGLGRLHWFSSDVTASLGEVVIVGLLLAVISVAVAHRSMTSAVTDPLAERQVRPRPQPHRRPLLVFVAGVVCLAGCVAWPTPSPSTASRWLGLFVLGNLLAAAGLLTGLPALAVAVSRLVGRGRRPQAQLAARRLALDPHMAARMMTGLLVVVIIAGFGQSMLLALDWAATRNPPEAEAGEPFAVFAPVPRAKLEQLAGVDVAVGVTLMRTSLGDEARVLVGPCADVVRLAHHRGICDDTAPQPVTMSADVVDPPVVIGRRIALWQGETGAETGIAEARMTSEQAGDLGLPAPTRWSVLLAPNADAELFKSRLLALSPASEATVGPDIERGRLVSTYVTLVTAATMVALALCMASTLAVLVDSTLERKTQSTQLLAVGVPGRLLRRAGAWWIGAPLAAALGLAGIVGLLSASAYLRFGQGSLHLGVRDLLVMVVVSATGLTLAVAAVVVSTPTSLDPADLGRQ